MLVGHFLSLIGRTTFVPLSAQIRSKEFRSAGTENNHEGIKVMLETVKEKTRINAQFQPDGYTFEGGAVIKPPFLTLFQVPQ